MNLKKAIIFSTILHVLLVILLVVNYQFSKVEVKQSGSVQPKINATAISSKRVEQLVNKIKQEKLDKKKQEQNRLDEIKRAEETAKRKRKEEETKAADAIKKLKIAEEKRKAEEVKAEDLKKKRIKDEQERKKKADKEKELKAETDRKNKIAEEKKKKAEQDKANKAEEERKRKLKEEAAEKKRQEAIDREMQRQLAFEAAELDAAHKEQVSTEVDKYVAWIRDKIKRNWIEPTKGYCIYRLQVSQGGLVLGVSVIEGNAQHCESGQRAIYKSEPLPVSKDPDVYEVLKVINLTLDNRSDENKS